MKLRKWIAGATCACMLLTLSPPVAVIAETLPQAATNVAARATIGDFNVTGGNLGTDYSFENDTLTIKSSRHLTIKTNATTAHRIKVAPNVQANITLAGVHIEVPNGVEAPAMDLHEAGASTINLAKDTTNTLDASRTGNLGAGLRTTKKGFVTINGPGTLIAKGGQKWPGIGGFAGKMEAGDQYPGEANIRITGGTIEASTATKELAAAIGGSQKQGYPNIQITGGKVTAYGDIGPGPTVPTQAEFGKLTISNAVVQVVSDTITKSQRDFNDCIVGRNLVEYNVYGNWTISEDVTIPQGIWLNVESGGRLNIGAKATLTNKGGVHVWGNATINADGALVRAGKGQCQVESGGKILNNTPPVSANGYTIVGNTVQAKPGYEISFNQSSWSNSEEFKTNTTYYIRKKGDAPTFGPSESNSFSFSESNRLPVPTVTLDYVNETLSTDESMEYDTRFINAPWPTCPKNMPLSKLNDMHGWKNGQYEGSVDIRTKAREGFLASEAITVIIPARPVAPTVGFSYKNGTIGTDNSMEYRMSDNEGWTACNGNLTILDEWFGKTMQIRTKAVQGQKFASFAQKLQIPSHEVLNLTIDTAKEGVTVPSGHRYKVSGAKEWTTSTGELVTVAPGETIEIVKPSTDSSFQSKVLRLTAPARGAHQDVTFHYASETVTTTAAMQYRVDGGKWTDCTANMKIAEAWFGKNVEFRTKATAKNYASEAQTLMVPARTEAPTVAIDYSAETLGTTAEMEYRVGDSGNWSPCTANMKVVDNNWFGKTVQFRTKATNKAFASAASTIDVPTRLATPDLSIVNANEGVTIPRDHRYKIGDAQNWTDGTGALVKVESGQTIVIYKPETASSFKSLEQTLIAPAKGTQPSVTIDYASEMVNTTDRMEYRVERGKWTDCTANMKIAEAWFGKNVEFRTKATDKNYASEAQTLPVPARTEAPTVAIDYSAETLGTTAEMEYRVGDSKWEPCTANMSAEAWFGKTVQFRTKATNKAFASETQTLSVSARPEAPSLKLDNAAEAVIVPQDHYYSTTNAQYDNGNWKQGDGSAVKVGEKQSLYIYKAATENAFKSQVQTLTAPAKGDVPNVTADFDEETLSTTTAMEYRVENGDWKDCTKDMKANAFGWNGKADVVVAFRTKATDKNYASDVQNVTITQRPAVPTDVKPSHVSVIGREDGAITGVTADMEYKLDSEKSWTDCGGKEVHNLAAGTYQVRTKATDNAFASEVVTVTIKKGAQLAVDAVDLGSIAYGYEPQAHTITIINNGDCDADIESVVVSKDSHFEVAGAGTAVNAGDKLTAYTIRPKAGLNAAAEKPYTDTITVTYNNGAAATATVTFTVIKAEPVVKAPTAKDLTYNGREQALVTAGNTNGGTLEYRLGANGAYSTDVPKAMNAGTYTVYYRVVGNDNFNPAAEQPVSVTIKKAPQVVPSAPEAEKKTLYSITLKSVADANGVAPKYGIKNKEGTFEWQDAPLFENLSEGTNYTFAVYYPESANYLASEVGPEAVIRTSSRSTYPPIVPEVEGGEVIIKPNRPTIGQIVIITPKPEEGMVVDKVTVTDKNGNQIEVTQKPNGDFTFKQPSGKVTITVTFKPAAPSDLPFIDVPQDAWYRDAVEYVYNNGLIMGVSDNQFAPLMTTSRGQLVTILWRLAGAPDASNDATFSDVASDAYYAKAVAWGAENGIVAGFADGSFRPNDGVSREQMAAFFMKFSAYSGVDTTARTDISNYTDVNPNGWSYDALSWANAVGLLNGVGDGVMAPQQTATRAQIAAVIQRYCETIAK